MSAIYSGLEFKTQLEAQWAAFFDLAGWNWWINPAPVGDWKPDFKVSFKCGHSECSGEHTLLVSVLPVTDLTAFKGHPCTLHNYGVRVKQDECRADGGAAFGYSPAVTLWEISHGAGGGSENMDFRVDDASTLWARASKHVK